MKVAVFDIDGTIVIPYRARRCMQEAHGDLYRFLECFCSDKYICLDAPDTSTVEYMRRLKEEGYVILLVSGRLEKYRKSFEEQFKKWRIPFDKMLLNKEIRKAPNGELILKRELLSKIAEEYGPENVVEVHEDNPVIEQIVRELFPNARFVLHEKYALFKLLQQ